MATNEINNTPYQRAHLMGSYVDNMYEFMRVEFPQAPEKELRSFIVKKTEDWCRDTHTRLEKARNEGQDLSIARTRDQHLWPTVRMIKHISRMEHGGSHHSYGNITYFEDQELLPLISGHRDKIISPFGTFYETVDKKPSFIKGMIDVQGKQRKTEKKAMLQAKKEGDKNKETFHNNNQATIKINMNSLIGAMGSGFNFLSSIANFNSVTSIARFFIMNAYAHAERFLESNFYFRTEEQVIDFLVNCRLRGPDKESVLTLCEKHNFKIPTWKEVYDFLVGCLHRYNFVEERHYIRRFLCDMHPGELAFVFYMSNMKHLVFHNDDFFKPWISNLFDISKVDMSLECTPQDVFKLDGDLIVVLATVFNELLPINDRGNSILIYDCVEDHPEIAKQFVRIGKHFERSLSVIQKSFDMFMGHNVNIGYVAEHKQMFRDTVILSDTDSIVFTTKSWVEWFSGNLKLNKLAYNVNALVVYWLSKANENILFNVSKAFGAIGKDLFTMNMKNEFMMPIEILTSLKKHYVALLKIQEGITYANPRLDIKGVNLRGSNFCVETLKYVEWFIQTAINDIENTGKVSGKKKVFEVLQFERMVFDTLLSGKTQYLTVDPVKLPEEYADANRTLYFNYEFWEHLFSDKYGNIMLPTKCYVLPLTNIRHPKYKTYLDDKFPGTYERMKEFTDRFPLKDINRIPINPMIDTIPEELKPIINFRAVIYANAKPLYLLLQSFGISVGNNNKQLVLFSDLYGWVSSELGNDAIEHTA